jgi:alpha-tubulin suppressor-like RCC1 family protein
MNRTLLRSALTVLAVAISATFASHTNAQTCPPSPSGGVGNAIWAWGGNPDGQLGDGTENPQLVPVRVQGLSGPVWPVAISAGFLHSLALANDGTVWGWGDASSGKLGNGQEFGVSRVPVQVRTQTGAPRPPVLQGVVAIAAGQNHSLALKSNGEVWAWGANDSGQLGIGSPSTSQTTAVQVHTLSEIIAIATHADYSLALKKDGTVWAWGPNQFGNLGDGTTTPRNTPVPVLSRIGGPPLQGVAAIAVGLAHSLAVKGDGTVWAWGRNESGQLGIGTPDNNSHATPEQVQVEFAKTDATTRIGFPNPNFLTGVKAVAAGESFSLALQNDGTVVAWGLNDVGQLGDNGTENLRAFPTQVSQVNGVTAIAAGQAHSLAAESNGNVQDWGSNLGGRLGDGTTNNSSLAVTVALPLSAVTCVAGGTEFSLAMGPAAALLTVTSFLINSPSNPNEIPQFNVSVDGSVVRENISEGSSLPQHLSPGTHTVSETEVKNKGAVTAVIGGACAANGTIALAPNDNKTCTITNFDHFGGCELGFSCCKGGVGQQTMSRALLKMRSGRCHVYSTSSCCFVKHLFV